MELFLDTADAKAVTELSAYVTVAGVTTNPTIIAKSGLTPERAIDALLSTLAPAQKLFVQVAATDHAGIMADVRRISAMRAGNVYAKIPVTRDGLRAIRDAAGDDAGVLATAIYTADQAFLAAMNGADYLSPYVNRMDNYGNGAEAVAELAAMLSTHHLSARIAAASFKNARQVHEVVLAGAHAVTVPPDVLRAMIDHPGTKIATDEFTAAWRSGAGWGKFG